MSDPYDLDGWREALDEIERLAQDRAGWVSTALDLAAESKRQAALLDRCREVLDRLGKATRGPSFGYWSEAAVVDALTGCCDLAKDLEAR